MYKSDIYERIMDKMDQMSKSQQKIAQFIINHPDSAPFLTASKMAQLSGVGEATVVRFAVFLGYQGYPDMQRHLQEALKRQWTTVERLQMTSAANRDKRKSVVHEILHDDIANLQATLQQIDKEEFDKGVKAIIEAENIYIIAYRSAVSLGTFLEFYLDLVLQNTELIVQADGISEHLLGITDKDLVIGMGFARYTKRTVEVMKYAKEKGAKTMCLTDHMLSPLMPYSDIRLTAASDINSFINSFVAPLSIINALITAVTRIEKEKVEKRLEELEDLWESFHVFHHSITDES
ncbi:N-acetylmannosamine kinase [Caldalkalibacillus thermarum]|uniref:MurR/RpiR family transcriptional regulator n=1 Tax=Caldalkalibacillus thermarum TaxID=296745 RepID=UPI001668452B|nr:MurR/RpiR family transcriptional regulator [Caldalkalibacillus thermarum]GGK35792.1 N-acetylmannosamine kinase [Caldalkalibacillus thermarum]